MKRNRLPRIFKASAMLLIFTAVCFSQRAPTARPASPANASSEYKASAAYAEVLERRTELQSNLESLLVEYTEDYPKVKEIRHTIGMLQQETDRLASARSANATQLTLALGKLIVRKVELETELWLLLETYKPEHPDVKRAKRKVDIYEAAIKEILG